MNASATEGIHETFNGRLRNKRNSWNFQWALAQSKTLKMPFCFEHLGICQINGSNFANPTDINPFCNIQRWGASGASPRSPVLKEAKQRTNKKKVATKFSFFFLKPFRKAIKLQEESRGLRGVFWAMFDHDVRQMMNLILTEISEPPKIREFPSMILNEVFVRDF